MKVFRQSDVTCMKSCRLRGDSLSRYNELAAGENL